MCDSQIAVYLQHHLIVLFSPLAALRSVLKAAIGSIHLDVYFFKNPREYSNLLACLSAQFSELPLGAGLQYQLCHGWHGSSSACGALPKQDRRGDEQSSRGGASVERRVFILRGGKTILSLL